MILSKLWSPDDGRSNYRSLAGHWIDARGPWSPQHPERAWEYGLVLKVMEARPRPCLALDVGGAGSPLPWIVTALMHQPMQIIDPEFNGLGLGEHARAGYTNKLDGKADFVSCISVLEHIENEQEFLVELAALLAPGGVLFLTVDYDPSGAEKDEFQFHWMRKRIYNPRTLYGIGSSESDDPEPSVVTKLECRGLKVFGEVKLSALSSPETIPGLGYTFASLCMQKPL